MCIFFSLASSFFKEKVMRSGALLLGLVVAVMSFCPQAVRAADGEKAFASGKTLLEKGDFRTALAAFARAARADRSNQEYLREYSLLRRIIAMRNRLDSETDPQRWEYSARALHAYYVNNNIYGEALALDEEIHEKLNSSYSAMLLGQTQLSMQRNAEAAATFAGLKADDANASTRALLGVALARQDKLDEARRIARQIELPKDAGPRMIYNVARVHAAVGNRDEALTLLTRCFESVAPSRLDGFKQHAKACPDFAKLAAADSFAKVLKTESKVAESKCSGGSSCAGCPMRAGCSKDQKE